MDYDVADFIPPNRSARFMAVAENAVLDEISQERRRQYELWGEQNWPLFLFFDRAKAQDAETASKAVCKGAASAGMLTWDSILDEEVAESKGTDDPEHVRKELVQVAAVCVAMIRCIDRNRNNPAWKVTACPSKKE